MWFSVAYFLFDVSSVFVFALCVREIVLQQCISNPIVYVVKKLGYNSDIMRQTACLVNRLTVMLHDGGSVLRLNDGFNVKLEVVG